MQWSAAAAGSSTRPAQSRRARPPACGARRGRGQQPQSETQRRATRQGGHCGLHVDLPILPAVCSAPVLVDHRVSSRRAPRAGLARPSRGADAGARSAWSPASASPRRAAAPSTASARRISRCRPGQRPGRGRLLRELSRGAADEGIFLRRGDRILTVARRRRPRCRASARLSGFGRHPTPALSDSGLGGLRRRGVGRKGRGGHLRLVGRSRPRRRAHRHPRARHGVERAGRPRLAGRQRPRRHRVPGDVRRGREIGRRDPRQPRAARCARSWPRATPRPPGAPSPPSGRP